mmetsp:Transcript_9691/g.16308  ORF Transcript_9691/g.16308 Transcript_9691/m.16308 type:complete len:264 (-) Transcript_9691:32-823(-)
MAKYDQKALWEYILKVTGEDKLIYIGHSQGTTQMFAAMTLEPDFYRERMLLFLALAPVVRVSNLGSKLLQDMKQSNGARNSLKMAGPELFTSATAEGFFTKLIVGSKLGNYTHGSLMKRVTDADVSKISAKGKKRYMQFHPAGTCFQQLDHFRQLSISGEFRMYDYGSEELNIKKYGHSQPPAFDLSMIKGFKICLYCGEEDLLSSPPDYHWLHDQLKENGNTVTMMEFKLGHLGLLFPEDKEPISKLIEFIQVNQTRSDILL